MSEVSGLKLFSKNLPAGLWVTRPYVLKGFFVGAGCLPFRNVSKFILVDKCEGLK